MNRRSEAAKKLILALLSACVTLAAVEAGLRARGYGWQPRIYPNEPTMHEPDPELGWRSKAGRYVIPAYQDGLPDIRMTFWDDGLRATAPGRTDTKPAVVVLGGSFTQGWAVSDEDTYAWKLRADFPGTTVLNYGTGAYGTYQSLLALKRHVLQGRPNPRFVLYGFVQHHELRNVGDPRWLRFLTLFSRRAHLQVPYCRAGNGGELDCRPPAGYPMKRLDERSALISLIRDAWTRRRSASHIAQAEEVTRKLLAELNRFSRAEGSRLIVVLLNLSAEKGERYAAFFSAAGIDYIDCRVPGMFRPEFKVPGEGHPNERLHGLWAGCLKKGLAPLLSAT
ncbi:MAG: hypothetical protein ABIJ96_06505 [Elusimicrobiota bacterium]